MLLLPPIVLIQQRFVLVILRRHGFEEGRLSLGEPGRPRAPYGDNLIACCCVVERGALAASYAERSKCQSNGPGWAGGGEEGRRGSGGGSETGLLGACCVI